MMRSGRGESNDNYGYLWEVEDSRTERRPNDVSRANSPLRPVDACIRYLCNQPVEMQHFMHQRDLSHEHATLWGLLDSLDCEGT